MNFLDQLPELSADELVSGLSKGREHVQEQLNRGAKGIRPCLLVHATRKLHDGEVGPPVVITIENGFSDDQEKARVMRETAQAVYVRGLVPMIVVMVCECWMVTRKKVDPDRTRPRDDPNKKEAVVVNALSIDGRAFLDFMMFERNPAGEIDASEWAGVKQVPMEGCSLLSQVYSNYTVIMKEKLSP